MTKTGSFTISNTGVSSGTLYWSMTLTETSVDYVNKTSTVSYSFTVKASSGAGFTTVNSNWFRMGINTVGNIYDCSYNTSGSQKPDAWYDTYYVNSNNTRKFGAFVSDAEYRGLKYIKNTDTYSSYTEYSNTSSGTFTVAHNADGSGTAKLIVWWGRDNSGLIGNFGTKKLESDVLTLTNTGGKAYIWNGVQYELATPYVWNGVEWKVATPYVWNGSSWVITK